MDDDSMSSTNYTSQSLSSRTEHSTEESSWTMYFEDFIANNDQDDTDSFSCSQHQNSSMVSDASFRKVDNNIKFVSKNRKFTAKKFVDEELEDTASSPSHSPKVNELYQLYMTSKELGAQHTNQVNHFYALQPEKTKDKHNIGFSQEEGQTLKHAGEGVINMGYLETQLRRKGLCLVPISRLNNNLT